GVVVAMELHFGGRIDALELVDCFNTVAVAVLAQCGANLVAWGPRAEARSPFFLAGAGRVPEPAGSDERPLAPVEGSQDLVFALIFFAQSAGSGSSYLALAGSVAVEIVVDLPVAVVVDSIAGVVVLADRPVPGVRMN